MTFAQSAPHFFKDTVDLRDLGDGVHFELLEPLLFFSAELQKTVAAPTGFVTDFASTPLGTRNVFPKSGPWNKPSIIHDAGYSLRLEDVGAQRVLVNKLEADRLFLEGMNAVNAAGHLIPQWKRRLMYRLVRWFGHGQFTNRRPEPLRHV